MCKVFTCRIFALFLSLCFLSPLGAEDFVIGTTSGYAPFVSLDEKGEYVGFDIDLGKELGKKLNRTVVLKDLGSMPALMLALKQGKIDAIIWAISITEQRQKQMDMVFYQGQKVTSLPLLFWKEIPKQVSCLEDMTKLPQAIICVEAGSFQDSFLQTVPGISLKYFDKVTDAILEIRYGKSMATMIDPSLIPTLAKQFKELKVLEVPLPASQQSLGNGICLNKSNSGLTALVRTAVAELQEEGKIAELEQKWNLAGT